MRVLFAWLGNTDLRAASNTEARRTEDGIGPIAQAVRADTYDLLVLLSDHAPAKSTGYVAWLKSRSGVRVRVEKAELPSPTHYEAIYRHATRVVAQVLEEHEHGAKLTFHLSPGTPAMTAIWILVAKTRFPARLIESSIVAGVQEAVVPFHVAAELVPSAVMAEEARLERLASGLQPERPEFSDIIGTSAPMRAVVARARESAAYSLPVLIQGESGTGKELFAKAIHRASPRRAGPLVRVNCGAIPEALFESEFFGHKKGSFTGATSDRRGHFEAASGGTLFLDEVGELSRDGQVRLLRVLQEKTISRVGESVERPVDCRIIAATNRELLGEVSAGRFREDLYYRLAILTLTLPALRERKGDLTPLVDGLLARLNEQLPEGVPQKKLSPGARNLLLRHDWPGNIRELEGVLWRASVWASGATIEEHHVIDALGRTPRAPANDLLGRPLGGNFSLDRVLEEVARHYIERALVEAEQNRTKAARLVGFRSYQRLNDWIAKYGIRG